MLICYFNIGGLRSILTDRDKLVVTIGGATALAAGVYSTRFVSSFPAILIAGEVFYHFWSLQLVCHRC